MTEIQDLASVFLEHGHYVNYEKNKVIFNQGEFNDELYYIKSGLLKAYYLTEDGKEFIKSFISENNIIGNLSALMSDERCSFNLVCLENSDLLAIKFSKLTELAKDNIIIANILIKLLSKLAIKKEDREYTFLCLSADERYEALKKQSPEIIHRVTQNDIAHYLGVTPVALSRIRSKKNRLSHNSERKPDVKNSF